MPLLVELVRQVHSFLDGLETSEIEKKNTVKREKGSHTSVL